MYIYNEIHTPYFCLQFSQYFPITHSSKLHVFFCCCYNQLSPVNAAHTCMHVGISTGLWKPTSGLVGTSSRTNDFAPYPLCIVNNPSVWGGVWRLFTPPMLQLLKYLRKGTMVPLYFASNSHLNGNTIGSKLRMLSSVEEFHLLPLSTESLSLRIIILAAAPYKHIFYRQEAFICTITALGTFAQCLL